MSVLRHRAKQVKLVPRQIGAYALCDLDNVPIYVGCSFDGIQNRVRRHLTSARSDIIANRLIDVWELAYVRAWPVKDKAHIRPLEAYLFNHFHSKKRLMNGSVLAKPKGKLPFPIPDPVETPVLPEEERKLRLDPVHRFPRQIEHIGRLVDQILTVKDSKELHLALAAHFERLETYYKLFLK
jgi:hypothetical protein